MAKKNEKQFCSLPEVPERALSSNVSVHRAAFIRSISKKWVNGTQLHYYFFDEDGDGETVRLSDGKQKWLTWAADKKQKDVVRKAFKTWKDLGIGLEFIEVDSREDAEVRIGFMQGDGSWSYVGRDIIDLGLSKNERTMNFGWSLTGEIDTAIHEIGHTIGLFHEHQNPNAGIVWDEEEVYRILGGPPNNWPRDKTYYNIIRKIAPDTVQGSRWDYNSIMHYPFGPGMIKEPERFKNGLTPDAGLSDDDIKWVTHFYPSLESQDYKELIPFQSFKLILEPGEQQNLVINPAESRKYTISTFGTSDSVIVLFEDTGNELVYLQGDDDSGEDLNASMTHRLIKGKRYILRARLYYKALGGEMAIMMW